MGVITYTILNALVWIATGLGYYSSAFDVLSYFYNNVELMTLFNGVLTGFIVYEVNVSLRKYLLRKVKV